MNNLPLDSREDTLCMGNPAICRYFLFPNFIFEETGIIDS